MARRYFYHMTDGTSLIIDRNGRRFSSRLRAMAEAIGYAERTMQEASPGVDWSGWLISIHDDNGMAVANVPFPTNTVAL